MIRHLGELEVEELETIVSGCGLRVMYNTGKREEKGQRREKGQWHCVFIFICLSVGLLFLAFCLYTLTLTQIMVTNGV